MRIRSRRSRLGHRTPRRTTQRSAGRDDEHARHHAVAAKSQARKIHNEGLTFVKVELPKQQRTTRIVKDITADQIAREIVEWIQSIAPSTMKWKQFFTWQIRNPTALFPRHRSKLSAPQSSWQHRYLATFIVGLFGC